MKPSFSPLILLTPISTWRERCTSFSLADSDAILGNAALTRSTYYENGSLVNLTSYGGAVSSSHLDSFCRLELAITTNPTTGSHSSTELWLPDAWNGRTLGLGNGGWSGGPVYPALAYDGVNRGFASFSTNTGHNGSMFDGTWAKDNPDAVVDFAHRAMHLSAVAAKALTAQYYGQAASSNYYLGCSTGGRQGLKSVQSFPEDFDGVVVGAPANAMTRLQPWSIRQDLHVLPVGSPQWIPAALWPVIHEEVLRQCDALDGVKDGVISEPRLCNFRPEPLICRPHSDPSSCLTIEQVSALRKIYSDYIENGNVIFSRYEPGGELLYATGLVGPAPFQISTDFFKYFILNDTNWDFRTLDTATVELGITINPAGMDAVNPDITPFAGKGGKLLQYVGWADELIAPGNSVEYYDSVVASTRANSELEVDDFYRLFTVGGMAHCAFGDGANSFGGEGQRGNGMPPGREDAAHDILQAMIAWVEEGIAPSELIATRWKHNDVKGGKQYTRKLCMYPRKAVFLGGDENSAESFECR